MGASRPGNVNITYVFFEIGIVITMVTGLVKKKRSQNLNLSVDLLICDNAYIRRIIFVLSGTEFVVTMVTEIVKKAKTGFCDYYNCLS